MNKIGKWVSSVAARRPEDADSQMSQESKIQEILVLVKQILEKLENPKQ